MPRQSWMYCTMYGVVIISSKLSEAPQSPSFRLPAIPIVILCLNLFGKADEADACDGHNHHGFTSPLSVSYHVLACLCAPNPSVVPIIPNLEPKITRSCRGRASAETSRCLPRRVSRASFIEPGLRYAGPGPHRIAHFLST